MFTKLFQWVRTLRHPEPDAVAVSALPLAEVGPRALDLILEFEGIDQPYKRPPGESGITLGHGFDLGYCTSREFEEAWGRHLTTADRLRLRAVIGLKGRNAEAHTRALRACSRISAAAARDVFHRCTLPKWRRITAQTFPGLEVLTPEQQGVLVSLVFNRGSSMTGSRREEMRRIRAALAGAGTRDGKSIFIAHQLRQMQDLWPDIPGLQRRRRAEAALMEA